jgi:D-alanyl-D-alanine carboxypeptidase
MSTKASSIMKNNTLMKYITFAFFIFGLTACMNQDRDPEAARHDQIISKMDSLVKVNKIPGLNMSVVYKDGEQESFSSGFADVENKIALNAGNTLFSGSIGKTYAVAIIMQLIDEGRITLDDSILVYFPDSAWIGRLPNIEEITIRMLLQHTSGLPRYVMNEEFWDTVAASPDKVWSYKDRLNYVFDNDPVHEAGKGYHYSDTGYILLGMLIEKLTGHYYYDEVMMRLLMPGRLVSTYAADRRDIPHLPIGYSRLPEMFNMPAQVVVDRKYVFNPQLEWTGGGFASSTPDLAIWAKFYYEGRFISKSHLKEMTTPNPLSQHIGENLSYGMGSFIYETAEGLAYGHTGFVPGFNSIITYFPEQGIAIAMQTNCDYAQKTMGLIDYVEEIFPYLENPRAQKQ